jgi:aspartate aminotransferase-like enzyme
MPSSSPDTTPPPFGRFFLPGPTEVRPAVLNAQARPMIGHRGAGIQALIGSIQEGLRHVFRTERPVFISTSSATGMMEAALRNGARGRVLSLVNGAFSGRFSRIALACGFEMEVLEVPWGGHHEPDQVREKLQAGDFLGRPFDAVTVVHSETSTGALNDVEAIAAVVRDFPDTVTLVDSVSGVAGAPLHADRAGFDFVLTGSQKAFALPPGLSFGVASERLMERSAVATRKGVYFDLMEFANALEKLQTPNTPALSLFYALDEQLASIAGEGGEGIEGRWARHLAMAEHCWRWVDRMREERGVELSILAGDVPHRSPTVTCVQLPEDRSGPAVVGSMKERGYVIGGGYGKLKDESIRIGHMGDHTVEETAELLDVLGEVLTE